MRMPIVLAVLGALLSPACGDDTPTSPTTTTTAPTTVTYLGALDPGGTRFYSFTVATAGTLTVMLASVAAAGTGVPLTTPLELGIGTPAGTGCDVTTTQMVSSALTSQMTTTSATGTFCLRVRDAGQLTGSVTFAVRFIHP